MTSFVEYVQATLAKLGEIRPRKMFGGVGLYCDDVFFALIANDVLYLKVDDSNRGYFEELGLEGFQPFPEKPGRMNYYEIPEQVLQDPREAQVWARRSLEVARKKPARKRKKAGAKSIRSTSEGVAKLRNIGPKSTAMLGRVKIRTRADLERVGSVGAFLAVQEEGQAVSLNLLYALEGALLDEPWDGLPAPLKARLRAAVGR
jgi:DNA transformation protein